MQMNIPARRLDSLPLAEKNCLRVGYMRLSDAAPLVVAKELGLFARFGLDVELLREVSWANLRDKLAVGLLDAAQLLAPLAPLATLGAGGLKVPLLTGLVMSYEGNAVTVRRVDQSAGTTTEKAALRDLFLQLHSWGRKELIVATVHPFSMHTVLLRRWLQSQDLPEDITVRTVVLPPELMVAAMARGEIDVFCAGEPWNSIARQKNLGDICASSRGLMPQHPEKILAVQQSWHQQYPLTHLRLRLAVMEACAWLQQLDKCDQLLEQLSNESYLGLDRSRLEPGLMGDIETDGVADPFSIGPLFNAGSPEPDALIDVVHTLAADANLSNSEAELRAVLADCFRADLYREACEWGLAQSEAQNMSVDGASAPE